RRFKRVTMGATVVMGRLTWDEVGKPLPGRRNIVVSSRANDLPGATVVRSVEEAVRITDGPLWFIGGARIYEAGMPWCDVLDVTYVPDHVTDPRAVKFPPSDAGLFDEGPLLPHEDEPGLSRRIYTRRKGAPPAPSCATLDPRPG